MKGTLFKDLGELFRTGMGRVRFITYVEKEVEEHILERITIHMLFRTRDGMGGGMCSNKHYGGGGRDIS